MEVKKEVILKGNDEKIDRGLQFSFSTTYIKPPSPKIPHGPP